jgi:mannose-1-phosphate guanylyltransferase
VRRRPELAALLLAAGRGERLRPLTLELPKPLLPVAGRPLAARSLDRIGAAGCGRIAVNLHHRGEAIRATLGASWRGVPIAYSDESRELLGTGGALPPLAGFFAGARAIVVVNGDSLCRWPLERLLARHARGDAAATLLFARRVDPRPFHGGVAIDRGRVVAFRRGGAVWEAAPTRRVFAGAAVLDPALIARLPAGPSDIVTALYEPLLAEGATIAAVESARPWHDLGTPARYLEGALAFALEGSAPRQSRIDRTAAVAPSARVRSSMVEPGAAIGGGARLERCLVLPGAGVGEASRLERTIVGPGVSLPAATHAADTMFTRDPGGGEPVATEIRR